MIPMPWAVLVAGSREWTAAAPLIAFLRRFEVAGGIGPTLLHGGCRGADLMAADIVKRSSVPWIVHEFPAPWEAQGKRAGPARNGLMVSTLSQFKRFGYRTAVGAFTNKSFGGTWDCVGEALGQGFEPEVFGG